MSGDETKFLSTEWQVAEKELTSRKTIIIFHLTSKVLEDMAVKTSIGQSFLCDRFKSSLVVEAKNIKRRYSVIIAKSLKESTAYNILIHDFNNILHGLFMAIDALERAVNIGHMENIKKFSAMLTRIKQRTQVIIDTALSEHKTKVSLHSHIQGFCDDWQAREYNSKKIIYTVSLH